MHPGEFLMPLICGMENETGFSGKTAAAKVMLHLRAAADLLLPRQCIVCERKLELAEKHICLYCMADFPFTRFWEQQYNAMSDAFNGMIQKGLDRGDCTEGTGQQDRTEDFGQQDHMEDIGQDATDLSKGGRDNGTMKSRPREPYASAAALFFFREDSGYRNIQYAIKYKGDISAGRHFGRLLGLRLASSDLFRDVDTVIPVPLHWSRRWSRGYNQAEVIAKETAAVIGAVMRTDILIRRRRTKTQTRLAADEKEANVHGAFAVRTSWRHCDEGTSDGEDASGRQGKRKTEKDTAAVKPVAGDIRHILLIDDIFTTGATLYSCFSALRPVFPPPIRISVATLGYSG